MSLFKKRDMAHLEPGEQDTVKDIVYLLRMDGKIERIKSGRSYIIKYKN